MVMQLSCTTRHRRKAAAPLTTVSEPDSNMRWCCQSASFLLGLVANEYSVLPTFIPPTCFVYTPDRLCTATLSLTCTGIGGLCQVHLGRALSEE